MRYYRLQGDQRPRLAVRDGDGTFDLSSAKPELRSFADLARAASIAEEPVDTIAERNLDEAAELPPGAIEERSLAPVIPDEVWAAGVTYQISEEAREAESGMPEVYLEVYEGERPEVFFKATASRTVGPEEAIGVRGDSDWNVPEPELGVVLHHGEIVGYTVGNDVSSRSIEGSNPLYLPQAKVYDRCCAIGPCIASPNTVGDPHDLEMSMTIERDGTTMYEDSTTTAEMVKTCEELVAYYTRHNAVPETAVLLTGTALVPDEEFTLSEGDVVTIDIDRVGTLRNPVVTV
ncbi:fumarylacetoacetate hydrolase family protein [Halegenticoccus soli]|uniref:fumarylacetoacetate hydrolase family protein n=1 Tax=Halegenticoccus soli TaxID=1985678 RepID=UPI000C6DA508|nr:fumarylacetoacetate hydrolase family protein [Halegenticoccus soli]